MPQILIEIKKELNPEYYGLFDEYNALMERADKMNIEIHKLKVSAFNFWREKRKLIGVGKELPSLHKDFLNWSGRAKQFCLQPQLKFPHGSGSILGFLHYTAELRDSRNYLDFYITMLNNNYNLRYSEIEDKKNFAVAISSWFLSIIGLIVSLISLWITLCSPN